MMLWGTPYLKIISFKNFTAVWPSHLLMGFASIHLVNLSTMTRIWVIFPLAGLKAPTISRPQTAKGQVNGIVFNADAG
jgi:hypothetical protein